MTRVSVAQAEGAARGHEHGRRPARASPRRGRERSAGWPARRGAVNAQLPGTWLREGPSAPPRARPPAAGRRAAPRRTHTPRLRPRACASRGRSPTSTAARSSAPTTSAARSTSRRGSHCDRHRSDSRGGSPRPRARRTAAGRGRRSRCSSATRLIVWSHLTEPGDGAAGRLVAHLGAVDGAADGHGGAADGRAPDSPRTSSRRDASGGRRG